MSNYLTLSGLMLTLILLFTFRPLRRMPARPLLLTGAVLIVLTAVFDNLIVGADIVGYDDSLILGIRVPFAPIEDFAYAIGAVLLVPALWQWNVRLAPRQPGPGVTDGASHTDPAGAAGIDSGAVQRDDEAARREDE